MGNSRRSVLFQYKAMSRPRKCFFYPWSRSHRAEPKMSKGKHTWNSVHGVWTLLHNFGNKTLLLKFPFWTVKTTYSRFITTATDMRLLLRYPINCYWFTRVLLNTLLLHTLLLDILLLHTLTSLSSTRSVSLALTVKHILLVFASCLRCAPCIYSAA